MSWIKCNPPKITDLWFVVIIIKDSYKEVICHHPNLMSHHLDKPTDPGIIFLHSSQLVNVDSELFFVFMVTHSIM